LIDGISYSSTHVLVPNPLRKKIQDAVKAIPDDTLADPGRELDCHVTLLYGLVTNDPEAVREVLQCYQQPEIGLMTNGVSVFERPDYDVLKIDIISPSAESIHRLFKRKLENKWEWPAYVPHITCAYLKKGLGRIYCAPGNFEQFDKDLIRVSEVVFSDSKEKKTIIPLKGKK